MPQSYEGRPLARPDEELTDQGLGFDLGTLIDRRQLLRALGLGAATLGLAGCTDDDQPTVRSSPARSFSPVPLGEIPDETAGPYPGDGSNGPDVLEQSGVVRGDIRSSFGTAKGTAEGVPMTLELTLVDLANRGQPFSGAAVYVWHCDRAGRYSLYSEGIKDQNYLRGVQIADTDGRVRFTSIFPACYSGRWPHIHFEVYRVHDDIADPAKAVATSQVALPKDACDKVYRQSGYEASVTNLAQVSLAGDNVFGDDSAAHQLGVVTGDAGSGYTVSLDVAVDATTAPGGGQLTGDGAPSGAPGGTPPSGSRPGGPPPTTGP